ncbi:metallophosphoesterase [Tenacibaculum pacificus]|nr:metallophosphoesterase [Tenacibaculum pacificus]WBX74814.1 metallophosphoesterase [Tenacibaculum pacificus]
MIKIIIKNTFYLLLLISNVALFGQKDNLSEISDGPYIFISENKLIQKSIEKGNILSKELATNTYDTIFYPKKAIYKNVKKIAVLSDIHGQYDLAVELLKNNKIIDKNLNWNFGKGHLVIVGDIFDRGDKVNETLWLIYKLENEAIKKGGNVHFILGNHEYMVLRKDLRYISDKYKQTSKLLNLNYNQLYSNKTVIGKWLRSKPTILKINNNTFAHGGISKYFINNTDFDIENINNIMRASIDKTTEEMKTTNFYNTYYGNKSLIWYRGYFNDNLKNTDVSDILKDINSKHIIVGHCSNETVVELFNHKVFGVDSSIKNGKYGELLLIKNNKYFRATLKGKKIRFKN